MAYFKKSISQLIGIFSFVFVIFHFRCSSASYDIHDSMEWSISNNVPEITTVPSQHVVSSCTAFINEFSAAASDYTRCSISFSRPLRFCENCVKEYLAAMESYNLIMEGNAQDEAGALCSDVILKSDRIQIIEQTFHFIKHIWDQCHCDECFFGYNMNTTESALTNETLTFMTKANDTQMCFRNFTHGADIMPFVPTNESVDPLICEGCRDKYQDLNTFYYQLSERSHGKVCMDIIDIMNSTRLLWSKEFKCSRPEVDNVPVILLSIFFCTLPILFYVSNKIHGTKTEQKLLKQKRLREAQMTHPETDTSTEDVNVST